MQYTSTVLALLAPMLVVSLGTPMGGPPTTSFSNGTAVYPTYTAPPSYTTTVVTALTTVCPTPTEITTNGKTYTVTSATTLTITDCPCTLTQPVSVAPTAAPAPVPAPAGVAPVPGAAAPVYSNGTVVPGAAAPSAGAAEPSGSGPAVKPLPTGAANKVGAAGGMLALVGFAAAFL